MKILAVHTIGWDKNKNKEKATCLWRIKRPIDELKKHVDWQIDEQPTPIPEFTKYKSQEEFTPEEMENAAKKLGEYDWAIQMTSPSRPKKRNKPSPKHLMTNMWSLRCGIRWEPT